MQGLAQLLMWIEKGSATRQQARKSKRDTNAAWVLGLADGLFVVGKDEALRLTPKGQEELTILRLQAG